MSDKRPKDRLTAPTSHDVAKLAGVSQPTVSRALRGKSGVSSRTAKRVADAVAALDYVPSQLGRSLSTRKTGRVGIVAAELTNPFYPHLVEPLYDLFESAGYRCVLFAERAGNHIQFPQLVDGLLDGVVLMTSLIDSPLPASLSSRGLPFVFLNRRTYQIAGDFVGVNNAVGAALVADHLISLGHREIGALFGPSNTSTGVEREFGFIERLNQRGHSIGSRWVRGEFSFGSGVHGLRTLLQSEPQTTAIFCANDVLALGALDEAERRGIRVPEDLSIIGFDDISLASWSRFNLTTVHCDLVGMASSASELLLKRIADPLRKPREVIQQPSLQLRGSHARL